MFVTLTAKTPLGIVKFIHVLSELDTAFTAIGKTLYICEYLLDF